MSIFEDLPRITLDPNGNGWDVLFNDVKRGTCRTYAEEATRPFQIQLDNGQWFAYQELTVLHRPSPDVHFYMLDYDANTGIALQFKDRQLERCWKPETPGSVAVYIPLSPDAP